VFVYPAESRGAGEPLSSATRAEELRGNLRRAGCRRHQLFQRDEERRPICIHDLRATFITISLAQGKTESWVANRTGHKSSKMINEYRRQAQCHAEVVMGALAPLVEVIPELAAVSANLRRESAQPAE
jgi:integrase